MQSLARRKQYYRKFSYVAVCLLLLVCYIHSLFTTEEHKHQGTFQSRHLLSRMNDLSDFEFSSALKQKPDPVVETKPSPRNTKRFVVKNPPRKSKFIVSPFVKVANFLQRAIPKDEIPTDAPRSSSSDPDNATDAPRSSSSDPDNAIDAVKHVDYNTTREQQFSIDSNNTAWNTSYIMPSENQTSSDNLTCLLPSIVEFPPDLFNNEQRRKGAIITHVLVAAYMFVGLAIVCDYYFISSLEVICHKFKLQTDVAGASLMAIGSSAPELFASLIGVFVTKGDIGIGTILGSAVFNVLFVLGICGLVASTALSLAWWPLTRDCLCYCFTLIVLAIVIFDGSVTWKEAAVMLLLYVAYLALMWYNERIEKKFYLYIGDTKTYEERFPLKEGDEVEMWKQHAKEEDEIVKKEEEKEGTFCETDSSNSDDDIYPEDDAKQLLDVPVGCLQKVPYFILFPLNAVLYLTIPDIRRKNLRGYVHVTFCMSILWIGALTYVLVWMVTIIGFTLSIPEAVMGLTLVAFGSSLPDALTSVYVARIGKGDMAVAQALGSNVFDILFSLGLPWLIKTLIFDLDSTIEVQSVGMLVSSFIIFILIVATLGAFHYRAYKLDKKLGALMLVAYALFLLVSVVMETLVWNDYHPPTCNL